MSTLSVDTIQGQTTSTKVKMPAGHIIQTVMATTQTLTEFTGNGYVDTALDATITPQFSTSKILVIHSAAGIFKNHDSDGNNTGSSALLQVKRNGVVTSFNQSRWGYNSTGNYTPVNWSFSYLDSPATTSATTYKITIGKDTTSGNIRHNDSDGTISGNPREAQLILMEIAQ